MRRESLLRPLISDPAKIIGITMKKLAAALLGLASLFVLPTIFLCGQIIYNIATFDSVATYDTTTKEAYKYTGWDASKDEKKAVLSLLFIAGCLAVPGIIIAGLHEKSGSKNRDA